MRYRATGLCGLHQRRLVRAWDKARNTTHSELSSSTAKVVFLPAPILSLCAYCKNSLANGQRVSVKSPDTHRWCEQVRDREKQLAAEGGLLACQLRRPSSARTAAFSSAKV